MTRYRLLTGLAVSLLLLFTIIIGAKFARAQGAAACGESKTILKSLADRYGEVPTAMGIGTGGDVVGVLSSDAGTFTIIVTSPQGITCLIFTGTDWSMKPVKRQGKDL